MERKRVFVVDDDEDLLKMLRLRLEAGWYEFMFAESGKDMIRIMKMKRPDVVLLDIMLPEMDGYSALLQIRRENDFKDIPVIIMSAKEKKNVGDLFTFEKIAFFVEKPFEIGDLLKKIKGLLV